MDTVDDKARLGALAKLRRAQRMISEGRNELAAAQTKIKLAQQMIDESAAVLRDTWTRRKRS
jgi:hypothetical protein